jgi:hypothetical protein
MIANEKAKAIRSRYFDPNTFLSGPRLMPETLSDIAVKAPPPIPCRNIFFDCTAPVGLQPSPLPTALWVPSQGSAVDPRACPIQSLFP